MHTREMRRNIWRGLLTATNQEIHEGMHFYQGAHGLCKLFSSMYGVSVDTIAGLYAALSPLNTWDTNVSNIVDVLRWVKNGGSDNGGSDSCVDELKVNTPHANKHKAILIAQGHHPSEVLRGRKVTSFYKAIVNPSDRDHYPIDRHLINLAMGTKITANSEIRDLLLNQYDKIEHTYRQLGKREGIDNLLASIAWFVQRRSSLQQGIFIDGSPVCCGVEMWSHGRDRFYCKSCRKTRKRQPKLVNLPGTILTDDGNMRDMLRLSIDDRGRVRVHMGRRELYMNSGGWQYLARYEVMKHTGEVLRPDEHVHHSNGRLWDCRTCNLEVWLAERHGQYHAKNQLLYMVRDYKGRFTKSDVPSFDVQYDEMGELMTMNNDDELMMMNDETGELRVRDDDVLLDKIPF